MARKRRDNELRVDDENIIDDKTKATPEQIASWKRERDFVQKQVDRFNCKGNKHTIWHDTLERLNNALEGLD